MGNGVLEESRKGFSVEARRTARVQVPIRGCSRQELEALSCSRKLGLSVFDMMVIQKHFRELLRDPTDVELEVLAQTWSEHCKHRVFNARIIHHRNGKRETINGIFRTFVRSVTGKLERTKPGFVLSAFGDNAGFIRLDDEYAVGLKVETHNHPSALEPYAGSNTGLGGVIRDILGAGRGARPLASLDVFCFGAPDYTGELDPGTLHPRGIFRGVVKGVRDYGNRMGIPTVAGAIHFDRPYMYNPLVFCGTAGVIRLEAIDKSVRAGDRIIAVGGRTGRDGLRGATFSSAALTTDSQESDRGAVQIGNPIEEKKVLDFVLEASEKGLVRFITDCGAGGFSSAVGEMVETTGGRVYLERIPLKEEGLSSWEIFLSESQERMVIGTAAEHIEELVEIAHRYETECVEIGEVTDTRRLQVYHHGEKVCDIDCEFLHRAPTRVLESVYFDSPQEEESRPVSTRSIREDILTVFADLNVCSREPVIREYDFEVMGNTVVKPLCGNTGDAPSDSAVLRIDGSTRYISLGVGILPDYDRIDPYSMGSLTVDEAVRQLVSVGTDPDKIAILDNFCMGDPEDPKQLGHLVECARGMSVTAEKYGTPFISGKDSFYNFYETREGEVIQIPVTLLISSIGILPSSRHIVSPGLKQHDSVICMLGETDRGFGGSVYSRITDRVGGKVPSLKEEETFRGYRRFFEAVSRGLILSAHDVSEGGLVVTLGELGFGGELGIEVDLETVGAEKDTETLLFSESPGRIVFEACRESLPVLQDIFRDSPVCILGNSTKEHRQLCIKRNGVRVAQFELQELKEVWSKSLSRYY